MRVLLAVPTLGFLQKQLFISGIQWCYDWIRQADENTLKIIAPSEKCNSNNYQGVAKEFWEGEYDYLIQIDDDNPPSRNPFDLVEYDKDIIALPTPIWRYRDADQKDSCPFEWNVYRWDKEDGLYYNYAPPTGGGLQKIDACGAGAMVIHRRVFDAPLMRKEGWHRKWRQDDGTVARGLDLAFCERARKCGFEVWCHWDYRCHHFKMVDLLDVAYGFQDWMKIVIQANGGTLTMDNFKQAKEHAVV